MKLLHELLSTQGLLRNLGYTPPLVLGLASRLNDFPEVFGQTLEESIVHKLSLLTSRLKTRQKNIDGKFELSEGELDLLFNPHGLTSMPSLRDSLVLQQEFEDELGGPKPAAPYAPKEYIRLLNVSVPEPLSDQSIKLLREYGQEFLASVAMHGHFAILRSGHKLCSRYRLEQPKGLQYTKSQFLITPSLLDRWIAAQQPTDLTTNQTSPQEPGEFNLDCYGANVP